MYKLIASYQTGDSFHNEDTEDLIDEFESKEVAIAAMNRLQEHYKWYEWDDKSDWDKERDIKYGKKPVEEPEWHKELEYNFQVTYYNDLGNLVTICAPYCGYFEQLYCLEITESLKIEF